MAAKQGSAGPICISESCP